LWKKLLKHLEKWTFYKKCSIVKLVYRYNPKNLNKINKENNMKKIAFFGGSFNPPNNTHLSIAQNILKQINLDELYFVPVGNYYNKKDLIDVKHRFEMLKILTQSEKNIDVLDITLNEKQDLKAIDIFYKIKHMYINDDIYFIMGADNFSKILSWKNVKQLVKNFKIIIVERDDININEIIEKNSILNDNKNNLISVYKSNELDIINSTKIREKINLNEDISNFLNEGIYNYILDNKLY